MVGASPLRQTFGTHGESSRRAACETMVPRACTPRSACQSPSLVPEVTQVVRVERASQEESQNAKQAKSHPIFEINKVLPTNHHRLGRSGLTSLSTGLQHAEPSHSSQKPDIPPSRLQLQPQACQDAYNKRAKEVTIRKRI